MWQQKLELLILRLNYLNVKNTFLYFEKMQSDINQIKLYLLNANIKNCLLINQNRCNTFKIS